MVSKEYVEQRLQRMRVWMHLRGLAPVTVSVYLRCARQFIETVGEPLGSLKPKDVERYMHALGPALAAPLGRAMCTSRRFVVCCGPHPARRSLGGAAAGEGAAAVAGDPERVGGGRAAVGDDVAQVPSDLHAGVRGGAAGQRGGGAGDDGHRQQADADPRADWQDGAALRDVEPARARGPARLLAGA